MNIEKLEWKQSSDILKRVNIQLYNCIKDLERNEKIPMLPIGI